MELTCHVPAGQAEAVEFSIKFLLHRDNPFLDKTVTIYRCGQENNSKMTLCTFKEYNLLKRRN